MSVVQPLVMKSDRLQKRVPHVVSLMYVITAAKTVRLIVGQKGAPVIQGFDASAMTTALCDALLQSDSIAAPAGDVPGDTMFDSTALGSDSFGAVIDMQGQAKFAAALKYEIVTTAGGTPASVVGMVEGAGTAQLAVSTNSNGFAVSPAGNLYLRLAGISNLDSGTAGYIKLDLHFYAK